MKTRSSLVSNSSSSSFIMTGIPIMISELTNKHLDTNVFVIGRNLCEGKDIINVDDESVLKFIQDHSVLFDAAYYNCKVAEYDKNEMKLETSYTRGEVIVACDKDNDGSHNISSLIDHYLDAEELKKETMKLLKAKYGVKEDED